MTKTVPGPNYNKQGIQHGQGISVDFYFLVLSPRTLVEEKIVLVLVVKLVGY